MSYFKRTHDFTHRRDENVKLGEVLGNASQDSGEDRVSETGRENRQGATYF
ncbi:unnamed protein product [marine sediment metagenome]|uniref:Uncharacterized protein n=1 Tax=marine sediment metagenome TaxID=412755 RepID=X1IP51_9ZZZZ